MCLTSGRALTRRAWGRSPGRNLLGAARRAQCARSLEERRLAGPWGGPQAGFCWALSGGRSVPDRWKSADSPGRGRSPTGFPWELLGGRSVLDRNVVIREPCCTYSYVSEKSVTYSLKNTAKYVHLHLVHILYVFTYLYVLSVFARICMYINLCL